jgi:hypothetical protein
MRLVEYYSHLNGLEHILVHKKKLWKEIQEVISAVDAEQCRTKASQEARKQGRMLYSPIDINAAFKRELQSRHWSEKRTDYFVTSNADLIRRTVNLTPEQQEAEIRKAGLVPIGTYNQTDFVKDRIQVEVQLAKYTFVAFDMFVKHMMFFIGQVMDVGVEIVPMKSLEQEMSSGVPYYERALYHLLAQGRSTPAVPLVLIGIAP